MAFRHVVGPTAAKIVIVPVRLFALAKELAQSEVVEVSVPEAAHVADLRQRLGEVITALQPLVSQVTFALGTEYLDDATPLQDGKEVACIPPVSGG